MRRMSCAAEEGGGPPQPKKSKVDRRGINITFQFFIIYLFIVII